MKYEGKPILIMLEEIRLYIVRKITINRQLAFKTKGFLQPKVKVKFEIAKIESGKWLTRAYLKWNACL